MNKGQPYEEYVKGKLLEEKKGILYLNKKLETIDIEHRRAQGLFRLVLSLSMLLFFVLGFIVGGL